MGNRVRSLKRLLKIRDTRAFVGGAILIVIALLFATFSFSLFDRIVGWKVLTGLIGLVFLVIGIALISSSFKSRRLY
jgi:cadmium resistance protein CadD (predicted permease)